MREQCVIGSRRCERMPAGCHLQAAAGGQLFRTQAKCFQGQLAGKAGSYTVQVGWYRLDTLARLTVDGSSGLQNSVELGSLVVTAP